VKIVNKRKLSVKLVDLPARAVSLSSGDLDKIFGGGGCRNRNECCGVKERCCDNLSCQSGHGDFCDARGGTCV
jgi:hypothetical protein